MCWRYGRCGAVAPADSMGYRGGVVGGWLNGGVWMPGRRCLDGWMDGDLGGMGRLLDGLQHTWLQVQTTELRRYHVLFSICRHCVAYLLSSGLIYSITLVFCFGTGSVRPGCRWPINPRSLRCGRCLCREGVICGSLANKAR